MQPSTSPQTIAATGDPTVDGTAWLNATRFNVGYPTAIAGDTGLAIASKNHTIYLVSYSATGHNETSGLSGYTGATASSRIATRGTYAPTGEVVVSGSPAAFPSSLTPVQLLFDAPYHRILMLDNFTQMGVASTAGASWQAFNIDFGNMTAPLADAQIVAYPYPGQTGAPPNWFANESPNPFASQPQYEMTTVGYPVTIQTGMGATLSSISFTLTDGGGNNVDCLPVTPATDSNLTNGAMCVPYTPLQTNARYTVHVTGVLTSFSAPTRSNQAHPVDLTWSFTTAQVGATHAMLNNLPPRQLPRF